jgi:hypothetical protein
MFPCVVDRANDFIGLRAGRDEQLKWMKPHALYEGEVRMEMKPRAMHLLSFSIHSVRGHFQMLWARIFARLLSAGNNNAMQAYPCTELTLRIKMEMKIDSQRQRRNS